MEKLKKSAPAWGTDALKKNPTAIVESTAFEQWKAQLDRRYRAARYLEPLGTGYRDPLATRTDGRV